MKGNCEICGKEIEVEICCSGRDCGCMGLPSEPPVCSEQCLKEYQNLIRKVEIETFGQVDIPDIGMIDDDEI